MSRPYLRRLEPCALGGLCALVLASLTSEAHAQDSAQAENKAAARTLGVEGVQLADAGKCGDAVDKLERAEALYHAPTILGRLGECQVTLGHIVVGTENLNRVVREQLATNAPQVFRDAQARAQKVLNAATPKIAHLTVKLDPPGVKATVAVDGVAMPDALVGAERPTDPGAHEVSASAPGYLPAKAQVTLTPGGHQELSLRIDKDPNVAPPPAAITPISVAPAGATLSSSAAPAKPSNTFAYVMLGVGGAGLVVGGTTGVLAIGKASDCKDKVCDTQSKLDDAKSMATISTVAFGVGIASLAVGTILLLSSNRTEPTPGQVSLVSKPPSFSVQPWLGANALGLTGSFQ